MVRGFEEVLISFERSHMNLAHYVKCLKRYAKNRSITDEKFFNAVLRPYIDAGEVDNKRDEELYFDKSRTSLLLNRHDDIPGALRAVLNQPTLYEWTEENFVDFIEEYLSKEELSLLIAEVASMVSDDPHIKEKEHLLNTVDRPNVFLADVLIECIKLKNNGFDPEGEIVRNGANCVKVIYEDIFKYAFRKRSREKNIIVIPVDTKFHTHVTRKYENSSLPQVSEKTVHGQWLIRWEQSGEKITELPGRIQRSLGAIFGTSNMDREFQIGTIAVVEHATAVFYLLAISRFDDNNNAQSSREEIEKAVDELSIFYDRYGEGLNLYIPLLGTGRSRSNLSLQESYDILIECYKNHPARIQGNINIVVHKDFESQISTI